MAWRTGSLATRPDTALSRPAEQTFGEGLRALALGGRAAHPADGAAGSW